MPRRITADLAAGAVRGPVLFWHTHASTDLGRYIEPDWQARLPARLRGRLAAGGALVERRS
jgi:hypothetical protein